MAQPAMLQFHGGPMGSTEDRLRFGVEFSDGRKATNLGPRRPTDESPPINLGMGGGGGGSGTKWWSPTPTGSATRCPPAGPITIAVAWPHFHIPEKSVQFDAAAIIEAATRAEQLWEDDRPYRNEAPSAASSGGEQTVLERP